MNLPNFKDGKLYKYNKNNKYRTNNNTYYIKGMYVIDLKNNWIKIDGDGNTDG